MNKDFLRICETAEMVAVYIKTGVVYTTHLSFYGVARAEVRVHEPENMTHSMSKYDIEDFKKEAASNEAVILQGNHINYLEYIVMAMLEGMIQ